MRGRGEDQSERGTRSRDPVLTSDWWQVCSNQGVCVLEAGAEQGPGPGYECQCQESYTGHHCQVTSDNQLLLHPRYTLSIDGSVFFRLA